MTETDKVDYFNKFVSEKTDFKKKTMFRH